MRRGHTIAEDTTKVVAKKMRLCVDEVVLEDVLGCTDVTGDETVTLKKGK